MPVYPERDAMEEELIELLRSVGRRNHRSRKDQAYLMEGDAAPQANKNTGALWPKFKGPSTVDSRTLGRDFEISAFPHGKYCGVGYVSKDDMIMRGIPEKYAENYARALNGSVSRNTWKQRKSVLNTVKRCEQGSGYPLDFPWGDRELQIFVGWAMDEDLKAATISQYVSNIRALHRDMNMTVTGTSWPFLQNVLKGHDNLRKANPSRIPMTPDLMFELKRKLSKSKLCKADRRLIWVICTCLFVGNFRVGEILSPTTTRFCMDTTLLGKDVRMTKCNVSGREVEMLKFRIKKPKETKGQHDVEVEMFNLGWDCFYNPTEAWSKWRKDSKLELREDLPVFRQENGRLFTARDLNVILKTMLAEKVMYMEGYVASHSFRAGLVSVMARLGYTEEQIKRQGRWRSDAYQAYVKMERAARLTEQWEMASKIAALVTDCVQSGRTLV